LRTYVFEDVLRRALEMNGYRVRHVVNITDVGHLVSDADEGEDKMEKGSRRTGESAWAIAQRYTAAFQADWRALNLLEPTAWPCATGHIPEQLAFIAELERKGFTYRTADGIYFDTTCRTTTANWRACREKACVPATALRWPTSAAPATSRSGSSAPRARSARWNGTAPGGAAFPAGISNARRWLRNSSGRGSTSTAAARTTWPCTTATRSHRRRRATAPGSPTSGCTATSSRWTTGRWPRPSGDFLRLQTLVDQGIDPLAYRYLCLGAHYRSTLRFTDDAIRAAQSALDRLRKTYASWPRGGIVHQGFMARFEAEVDRDLNLPRALAVLWELVRSDVPPEARRATVDRFDAVLGLRLAEWAPLTREVPADIAALFTQCEAARTCKDWAQADRLREALVAAGWRVEDGSGQGPAPI
jgi:cysteinyl-tRNA synthetase